MSEKVLLLHDHSMKPKESQAITLWPGTGPGEACLTTGKYNRKIQPHHADEICKMLATGLSTTVVALEIERRFGISIARQTIHETYVQGKKWKSKIDRLRKELDKQLANHPAKSQRVRLDLIMIAINKCLEKDNLKSFASLMRVLQVEVDGMAPLVDNSTHYHFNKLSDEALINKAREVGVNIPPGIAARIKQQIQDQKN